MINTIKAEFEELKRWWQKKIRYKGDHLSRWQGWFITISILIIAAIITFISTVSMEFIPERLDEGMIAYRGVKADRAYDIIDKSATKKLREEAEAKAPLVYVMNNETLEQKLSVVADSFTLARKTWAINRGKKGITTKTWNAFKESMGIDIGNGVRSELIKKRFSFRVEGEITTILKNIMSAPIVEKMPAKDKKIEVRLDDKSSEDLAKRMISLAEAKKKINLIKGYAKSSYKISTLLLSPNCEFDESLTEKVRDQNAHDVKDVVIRLMPGEMIIRHGARFSAWHVKVLQAIQEEKEKSSHLWEMFGILGYVVLVIIIPFLFASKLFKRFKSSFTDYLLMIGVGLSSLLVLRLGASMAPGIKESFTFPLPVEVFVYVLPLASAAMLLKLFLAPEIVLVFVISLAACAGVFPIADFRYSLYILFSSVAAILFVSHADKRGSLMRAGVVTGAVSAAIILLVKLMASGSATQSLVFMDFVSYAMAAFISGIVSAGIVLVATPMVEHLTGYASDIKLLELANLNHPLLRELIVRAPGTYHHSHLIGVLGEAAADKIGANSLLVRVGAYYHDIGKMKKPQYFVENNLPTDPSKHDNISPQMSALVLLAHVKDGAEMAKKAGLPKVIVDMIPEHHGKRLMRFFYEKAKTLEDVDNPVEEKDFRYLGPKPQSREAAILMLADSVEAATRALKEKTPARIQQTVSKIINDVFTESQLDECDLTLKDLTLIGSAFCRILLGIYHQRIEYPKEASNENNVLISDKSD